MPATVCASRTFKTSQCSSTKPDALVFSTWISKVFSESGPGRDRHVDQIAAKPLMMVAATMAEATAVEAGTAVPTTTPVELTMTVKVA